MIFTKEISEKTADLLLEIEAVLLRPQQPFQWASGWLSPIYCDGRLTLSYPQTRTYIKNCFIEAITKYFPNTEAIVGVATAGIPQGSLVADALNLPFLYVRSKPKGHGRENLIEGVVKKGQKVIVIEDVISTGKSSLEAVEALQKQGLEVLAVLGIFTYQFDIMKENFENAKIPLHTLSNYNQLLIQFSKQSDISERTMASLQEWRTSPQIWKGQ